MGKRASSTLSGIQARILRFIADYHRQHGVAPTVREIQAGCHLSTTSLVDYHLRRLEEKGYIERIRRSARGIVLRATALAGDNARTTVRVPFYGHIAAGSPMPTAEDHDADEDVYIWRDLLAPVPEDRLDDLFALRVRGDSMIDALVGDGDLVICLRTDSVHNGQMVAAWLPERNEVTLKYYYLIPPAQELPDGSSLHDDVIQPDPDDMVASPSAQAVVRLVPANPSYEPIEIPADAVEVHGRVVLVVRQLM
ncbi:MAG: LexA family transcriptional regulator [Ardenticatenia bacterium]|nr:LexA family transcriptional regulator [Ardenticatenia bacterium]